MRRRRAPESVCVIVEGSTDRKCLLRIADRNAVIVPANGKANLLFAFDNLERELRSGVLFLVDCDNNLPPKYRGHLDLVITENRDIEADFMLRLSSLAVIAMDYTDVERRDECELMADSILHTARDLSALFNSILDLARQLKLRVRIGDVNRNQRKISLLDLPEQAELSVLSGRQLAQGLIARLSRKLAWTGSKVASIETALSEMAQKPCRRHSQRSCRECWYRSYCAGHDLVDAVVIVCAEKHRVRLGSRDVEEKLREGLDPSNLPDWPVAARVCSWEGATGLRVLREGLVVP